MSEYKIIAQTDNSTVVSEYEASYQSAKKYQSEADLEKELINILQNNGYEYTDIKKTPAI
jgi:type I restriction enzyme R subunit